MKKNWWKESIVYQIYPRSFKDSNKDGIGDIPGIIEKLDYISSLGVDVIWVCPVYKSPNDDNGYDISDYRDIMNEFGTMTDFDKLLTEVHLRDMKLVMDLVPNHSSDEHFWFQESRKSKDNPYRDYYYWRPGYQGGPPNNWPSFFGGSVWQYDEITEEYYLHLFSKKQPDLNWENPKVRQEIYDIMRFWFDKGIDGFRMDVISLISKRIDFPDADINQFNEIITRYYANGPRVHEFLKEMHDRVLCEYDIMTVGEGPGIDLANGAEYVGESRGQLNMIFHFGHMFIDNGPGGKYDKIQWLLPDFKRVFNEWDELLKEDGWGSIFLGNHDFPRIVSRFGNDREYWKESAKLLATLLLSLRGTTYTYQGDEIGMTNVAHLSIEDYRDIETLNSWKEAEAAGRPMDDFLKIVHLNSRDNARTPMQWDDSTYGGFSLEQPWIKVNPNYNNINVASQEEDPDSILNYYRKMIRFRKSNPALVYGDYKCHLKEDPNLFVYERWDDQKHFLILLNFTDHEIEYQEEIKGRLELKINNYNTRNKSMWLRPWEAKIFEVINS
ncbi:alpha amylase, catalytic region [Fulvivirga imtechensis AK7]|uniref:Alpha amylase, catalytic region n=1 Tax=Fulvivirga imtechensis AK7 TaxID=1237149 RepID=L8JR89_9BACT|nr:alpha-glucosidase [Fulvivirga imtechensis]ELR71491.1 alpha amylase, catalytic region [Fulvivirga imtechensis AK7]